MKDQEIKDLLGRTIMYVCRCGHVYWKPAGDCPCTFKKQGSEILNRHGDSGWLKVTKYKFGKQKKTLEPEAFAEVMEDGDFKKPITHRGFLATLWYVGCRVSELTGIPERVTVKGKVLPAFPAPTIDSFLWREFDVLAYIPACKGGVERPPFKLSLNLPFIEYIRDTWKIAKKRKTVVFPFTRQTGWNIVKRVLPEHYCHFFRLNRCVNHLNDPTNPLNDIRVWFGWNSLDTVNSYLGHSQRELSKLSEGLA